MVYLFRLTFNKTKFLMVYLFGITFNKTKLLIEFSTESAKCFILKHSLPVNQNEQIRGVIFFVTIFPHVFCTVFKVCELVVNMPDTHINLSVIIYLKLVIDV